MSNHRRACRRNSAVLALMSLMLAVVMANAPSANAASPYDNMVTVTSSLPMGCPDGSTFDASLNWSDAINPSISSPFGLDRSVTPELQAAWDTLQDRLSDDQGGWGVTANKASVGDSTYYRYTIFVQKTVQPLQFRPYSLPADPDWYVLTDSSSNYSTNTYTVHVSCAYTSADLNVDVIDDSSPIMARGGANPPYAHLFMNFVINYPTGWEGPEIPTEYTPPPATYVAMGDSFSSGEGNPPFEYPTNEGGVNECHRSPQAYPRLLGNDAGLDLGPTAFVACSGATTGDVLYGGSSQGAWNESPQVDALSDDTEKVTITIGGNDVGFPEYATGCVVALCGPNNLGKPFYDAIMANINSAAFLDNLETTYETILEEAPNAEVYVMDYPYLVDPTGTDSTSCVVGDFSGALDVQQALNGVIADAVTNVKAMSGDYLNRLIYVPTNYGGSPFTGHHLCTSSLDGSSFNGNDFVNEEYSFHPNQQGQEDYAAVVEAAMS